MIISIYELPWSPPSERVRWTFRARGVPYRPIRYVPSSHHSLRLLLTTGRASVPVAFVDGTAVSGSTAIARIGDARGEVGESLFFEDGSPEAGELDAWDALADDVFRTARDLFGPDMSRDGAALRAAVDPLPLWGRALFPMAWRFAGWSFGKRYKVGSHEREAAAARLRALLVQINEKRAGRAYLVGNRFSYADIAVVAYLVSARPLPAELHALPPAIARHFHTVPEPGPWDELFAWRDEIWRKHH